MAPRNGAKVGTRNQPSLNLRGKRDENVIKNDISDIKSISEQQNIQFEIVRHDVFIVFFFSNRAEHLL